MRFSGRSAVILVIGCAVAAAGGQTLWPPQRTVAVAFVGHVTADGTNAPLPYAQVRLMTTDLHAIVNPSGKFRLEARIAPGDYVIRALMIGYTSAVQPVSVRDSGEISVPTFALKEAQVKLDDLVVPTCTRVRRRPARLPAGAWVLVERDSTGREILTLCRTLRH